jgi:hypothetical protein
MINFLVVSSELWGTILRQRSIYSEFQLPITHYFDKLMCLLNRKLL